MSQKREVDYEWAEQKAYQKNLEEFKRNPTQPDAFKRMQNYAKKHFVSLDAVIKKVQEDTDDLFARNFVKDPIRQSIHENEAAKFIKQNNHILNFRKLSASGANSLFLHKGEIISKQERDKLKLSSKSIDFYWEVEIGEGHKLKFYASHKYTNEEGGAQDHQYTEQRKFLSNAKKSKMGENTFFLALCEGNFYRKLNKKDSLSKIDFMNNNDKSEQSFCLPLCDLDDYIDEKIKEFRYKLNIKESSAKKTNKRKLKTH